MSSEEVLAQLRGVFREVFFGDVPLTAATVAADIAGWDSLTHVSLLLAVEETFGVRFSLGETEKTRNVGELVELIAAKRAQKR
jgi:acyl carrier protein